MEFLTIKEEPKYAKIWMKLKNFKFSKRCQSQKTTHFMIPFIGNVKKRKIHRK